MSPWPASIWLLYRSHWTAEYLLAAGWILYPLKILCGFCSFITHTLGSLFVWLFIAHGREVKLYSSHLTQPDMSALKLTPSRNFPKWSAVSLAVHLPTGEGETYSACGQIISLPQDKYHLPVPFSIYSVLLSSWHL